ncbi:hypothetical protein IMX12_13320 [Streptomyces sp. Babs14]|uniref:hypothetical protein n=1 Tax=unclassified Streptomyces TaxID=2593676 RepID=UPI001C2112A2|nr:MULTISPECIES: hypothetical protein [unclassified Streptomyces]MBU8549789.1 hypothetical protein [Streptomyces sp. Osf17]MBU8556572.1 hypothetical protein [Streptomyces sp. Babs14]
MQRAKQTFFAPGRRVPKGELFDDGDPFLKGREVLFEHVDVPAPAESAKPPAKKAAAKKPAG